MRFQSGDVFRKSDQSGRNSASHCLTSETLHVRLARTAATSVGTAAVGGLNVSIDEKYSGNLNVPVVKSVMTWGHRSQGFFLSRRGGCTAQAMLRLCFSYRAEREHAVSLLAVSLVLSTL